MGRLVCGRCFSGEDWWKGRGLDGRCGVMKACMGRDVHMTMSSMKLNERISKTSTNPKTLVSQY